MLSNKYLPNIISAIRICATAILLFIKPLSPEFIGIYTFAGATDVLDGTIARHYGTTSEFGAKLDSVADLLFYLVMLIRIFPVMWVVLPKKIWLVVGAILIVRGSAYLTAAFKHRTFASMHTYLNKVSGIFVFGIPYFILLPIGVPYCFGVCAVTMIASLEELIVHLTSKTYNPTRKSLLIKENR